MSELSDFTGGSGVKTHIETYSADTTLSADYAEQVIIVNATADGKELKLPDATTLDTGGYTFQIRNATKDTLLFDYDGGLLCCLENNAKIDLHLTNNSTTAGTWVGTNKQRLSIGPNPETPVVFKEYSLEYISVAALDSTHGIVCYMDAQDSTGKAVILDYSTGTIVPGTAVEFESGETTYISVTALDSTHAIVCYRESTTGQAVLLDYSTGTIVPATAVTFTSNSADYISVIALDSTHAIVCYRDNDTSAHGFSCALTYSTTISAATPVIFESSATKYISVTALDSTHAIVAYQDDGDSDKGKSALLDYSTGTIVPVSPRIFSDTVTTYFSVSTLDSTHAIVTYFSVDGLYACILNLVDTTATYDIHTTLIDSDASNYNSVTALDSEYALVCYRLVIDFNQEDVCSIVKYSQTGLEINDSVLFEDGSTPHISVAALDNNRAIVCYRDEGNSYYGTSCLLEKPQFNLD